LSNPQGFRSVSISRASNRRHAAPPFHRGLSNSLYFHLAHGSRFRFSASRLAVEQFQLECLRSPPFCGHRHTTSYYGSLSFHLQPPVYVYISPPQRPESPPGLAVGFQSRLFPIPPELSSKIILDFPLRGPREVAGKKKFPLLSLTAFAGILLNELPADLLWFFSIIEFRSFPFRPNPGNPSAPPRPRLCFEIW